MITALDGAGRPVKKTVFVQYPITDTSICETYTYTSFGHLAQIVRHLYFNNVPNPDSEILSFYYEPYNSTGIPASATTASTITLYPNPASSNVHLQFSQPVAQGAQLRIYNVLGSMVQAAALPTTSTADIPVSNLSPGLYTVWVKTGKEEQRLMLQICR